MRTDDDEPASLRRLYATSLGPVVIGLNTKESYVFIHLFDGDGAVAKESADEWDQVDLANLLRVEIGFPESEAQAIADKFLAAAKSEGHEPPKTTSPLWGILLIGGFVVVVLVVIVVGLWAVGSWIF